MREKWLVKKKGNVCKCPKMRRYGLGYTCLEKKVQLHEIQNSRELRIEFPGNKINWQKCNYTNMKLYGDFYF